MSKNKKGGLDQYGPERFGRLIATIRKSVRLKGLTSGMLVTGVTRLHLVQ